MKKLFLFLLVTLPFINSCTEKLSENRKPNILFIFVYYIKKFKNDKEGLKGRFKVLGQVGLGIIVGVTLYFHEDVTIKEKLPVEQQKVLLAENPDLPATKLFEAEEKSTKTTSKANAIIFDKSMNNILIGNNRQKAYLIKHPAFKRFNCGSSYHFGNYSAICYPDFFIYHI